MRQFLIWLYIISVFLVIPPTESAVEEVKNTLISFLAKLNGTTGQPDPSFGWNNATDPCTGSWKGVFCDGQTSGSVRRIYLNGSSLSGVFDAGLLCNVQQLAASLVFISLDKNNIVGEVQADIGNCRGLTKLFVGQNRFSGSLPDSLTMLVNLKNLDISYNNFSGNLPDLSGISGLTTFFAQDNQFTGRIPNFDFSNLNHFNVSFNRLSGPVPETNGRYPDPSSLVGNPELCGPPLQNPCPPSPNDQTSEDSNPDDGKKHKSVSKDQILMYSGYAILTLVIVSILIYALLKRKKNKQKAHASQKVSSFGDDSMSKPSAISSDSKIEERRSELSAQSSESAMVSTSLIVISSPVVNGLRFEDLLRAPAELLGRGKNGNLYKVLCDNGTNLVVKRIKNWAISTDEFKDRMERIYQASHPNVLPSLAFYSSNQEKLLVYEYHRNGSLFSFLQSTQMRQAFDWPSRLNVAAKIADALAFMHQKLCNDGIAHGNLKSSNILLNNMMEPCISEYGLMVVDMQVSSTSVANANVLRGRQQFDAFRADTYGLGVIILELLTGKQVQNNGMELTKWVHSVVREEWTAEVFDKSLISEGASEERMVNLLQVAIKCVNPSPEGRPTMKQVVTMINTVKEEEERSLSSYDP